MVFFVFVSWFSCDHTTSDFTSVSTLSRPITPIWGLHLKTLVEGEKRVLPFNSGFRLLLEVKSDILITQQHIILLVQYQHHYCWRAAHVQCTQNSVIFLWPTLQQDLGLPHLCKSTAQDYLQELEILSWKKGNNELFEWEFVEPERFVSLPITVSEETRRCIRSEQIGSARSSSDWEYLLWTSGLSLKLFSSKD